MYDVIDQYSFALSLSLAWGASNNVILIGNKIDLPDRAKDLECALPDMKHFEMSTKTGEGIPLLYVVKKMYLKMSISIVVPSYGNEGKTEWINSLEA